MIQHYNNVLGHVTARFCDLPSAMLEFLAEGSGTGFLHKKRVPDGLLGAPSFNALFGRAYEGAASSAPTAALAGSPHSFLALPGPHRHGGRRYQSTAAGSRWPSRGPFLKASSRAFPLSSMSPYLQYSVIHHQTNGRKAILPLTERVAHN